MIEDHIVVFAILGCALALFIWDRWRYDVIAFGALIVAALTEVVPTEEVFSGFGHPAVITVAMVLVISRALQNSGLLDVVARRLLRYTRLPILHMTLMMGLGAFISGFMNNVGALALLMPLAVRNARASGQPPSLLLMPLSFGTLLGGLMTEIGTPPNIIIANYRADIGAAPFSMFDFTPVGAITAVAGIAFIALIGWRLVPRHRRGRQSTEDAFEIRDYVSELKIGARSELIGTAVRELESRSKGQVAVIGVIRGEQRAYSNLRMLELQADDIVIVRADPTDLRALVGQPDVEFVGSEDFKFGDLRNDEIGLMELVVQPGARIENRSAARLNFRRRFRVNLLAIAREGQAIKRRLGDVPFAAGDVLLLQGEREALPDIAREMGCLPLATRSLDLTRSPNVWVPLVLFIGAIALTSSGLTSPAVAFSLAVGGMVISGAITPLRAYEAVDWPIIVLLGSMIPLGDALETTGGTAVIADLVLMAGNAVPHVVILALVMGVTMALTNVMNNAATAVVMAPIAAQIAISLGVSVDPFLIAVAIGASCAFLTPIGHQNNVLVMGPGGYRFGDYWRLGLPLSALVMAVSIPVILVVWPLGG